MAFWKSVRRNLSKVSQLSLADAFLILEAWLVLAFFNLASGALSLERLQGLMPHHSFTSHIPSVRASTTAAHMTHLTGIAAGLHPWLHMTCLYRALALQWMLSRRGILPVLRLGVLTGGSGILGHAWLEIDGVPLGEDPASLDRFSVLARRQNELSDCS